MTAPVSTSQRLHLLDVIRGFAISGVLLAYVFWNLGNAPQATYSTFDKIIDFIAAFLIDTKCYTLLAVLFGIGFSLHMHKAGEEQSLLFKYRKRLLGLFLIGIFHAVLLRDGDILVQYSIVCFIASLLYRASFRKILITMIIAFLLPAVVTTLWTALHLPFPQRPDTEGMGLIQKNLAYLKFWYGSALWNWEGTLILLLLGMLTGKMIIQKQFTFSDRALRILLFAGLATGSVAYVITLFLQQAIRNLPWDIGGIIWRLVWLIHGLGLGLFYTVTFYFLSRRFSLGSLRNLGRMALTNYIVQALIIIPLGTALNLFDHIMPTIAGLLFLSVLTLQILYSNLWLRHFKYGPLEWALRRFVYGRISKEKHLPPAPESAPVTA